MGEQLVELAIDAAVHGCGCLGIVEESFLLELLIHFHLVLRVHDVEVAVRGLQSHGVFTRVAHVCLSGPSFLGGHDNHTGHGAGTIDRGGRTVFQNLETLDVVGVEAGYGG